MYIIFNLDPDGDTYSLHQKLEKAQHSFDSQVEVGLDDDYKTLLCHITNLSDFGFGTQGDVYGMTIIDSLNWED